VRDGRLSPFIRLAREFAHSFAHHPLRVMCALRLAGTIGLGVRMLIISVRRGCAAAVSRA
jgi:hypothetical protein